MPDIFDGGLRHSIAAQLLKAKVPITLHLLPMNCYPYTESDFSHVRRRPRPMQIAFFKASPQPQPQRQQQATAVRGYISMAVFVASMAIGGVHLVAATGQR